MDEAASRLKIELDSMPTEIDVIEREIMQREMERQALKKEKDPASKERLGKLEKELADLKESSAKLKAQWQNEKGEIDKAREAAGGAGEFADAARTGAAARRIGARERDSIRTHSRDHAASWRSTTRSSARCRRAAQMLKEEVTEEDIAQVVSSWTHIPVSRLQEGERQKLVKMEERLSQRVIGQKQAIAAVSNAVRRARAGFAGRESADRFVHFSRADRCRAKRSCRARWRSFCSTTRTP